MNVPRPTLQKELKSEEKEIGDDISSLQKKVRILLSHIGIIRTAPLVHLGKILGEAVQRCSRAVTGYCMYTSYVLFQPHHVTKHLMNSSTTLPNNACYELLYF